MNANVKSLRIGIRKPGFYNKINNNLELTTHNSQLFVV